MVCELPIPRYPNPPFRGIAHSSSRGDGYSIELRWFQAFSDPKYQVAYNIYFSTIREDVFTEGAKFVIINPTQTNAVLASFKPGDVYYFAVRGTLFEPSLVNLNALPDGGDGGRVYPESMLLSTISDTDLIIPDLLPSEALIKINLHCKVLTVFLKSQNQV